MKTQKYASQNMREKGRIEAANSNSSGEVEVFALIFKGDENRWEVVNNPTLSTVSNVLSIIKTNNMLLLRQVRKWQRNITPKPVCKMDKLTESIYACIMYEWLNKKQFAQNHEQMLRTALQEEFVWRLYRNINRRIKDKIIGGCLLLDDVLPYRKSEENTCRSNDALILWKYIKSLIIEYANGTPYIKEILWAKKGLTKGSGMTANLSEIIAALYIFWQAEDAAIDSLNSEIKILKNVVKFPKVK